MNSNIFKGPSTTRRAFLLGASALANKGGTVKKVGKLLDTPHHLIGDLPKIIIDRFRAIKLTPHEAHHERHITINMLNELDAFKKWLDIVLSHSLKNPEFLKRFNLHIQNQYTTLRIGGSFEPFSGNTPQQLNIYLENIYKEQAESLKVKFLDNFRKLPKQLQEMMINGEGGIVIKSYLSGIIYGPEDILREGDEGFLANLEFTIQSTLEGILDHDCYMKYMPTKGVFEFGTHSKLLIKSGELILNRTFTNPNQFLEHINLSSDQLTAQLHREGEFVDLREVQKNMRLEGKKQTKYIEDEKLIKTPESPFKTFLLSNTASVPLNLYRERYKDDVMRYLNNPKEENGTVKSISE